MTELERLRALPHVYPAWEALLDLVERAATRRTAHPVGRSKKVLLERGELVTSERELAERWGWSRKAVQSFLAELCTRGKLLCTDLGSRKTGAGTKLTLCDFDSYGHHGTKRNQDRSQAKSKPAQEMGAGENHRGNQQPPHTPPVVHPALTLERSRPPQGGSGGGVASARDVDKCHRGWEAAPSTPAPSQLELAPTQDAEHLRFAEELAATLNRAQAENGRVDRDTYRPVEAWHRGTLAAALAIRNAGVPLAYATQYVWLAGQRFKPTAKADQIASLAYLQRGCIAAYRELERRQRHHQERAVPVVPVIERTRIRAPIAVGDLLAGVIAQVKP